MKLDNNPVTPEERAASQNVANCQTLIGSILRTTALKLQINIFMTTLIILLGLGGTTFFCLYLVIFLKYYKISLSLLIFLPSLLL